ncbi:MAG: hypothetical protein V4475_08175 [Pseudomonadota bacterium]
MAEHGHRSTGPATRADRLARAAPGPNVGRLDAVRAQLGGAGPVQRLAVLSTSANAGAVAQLARWRLTAQDTWVGIDPENRGTPKTSASGTRPVGTIHEDTDDSFTEPNAFSGTYKDWRKVVRPDEQVDHYPPNAAYTGTKFANISYGDRPAFPIRNREGHRPAQGEPYGFGGHVSTTNSTFVQKGFTPELNQHLKKGDFFSAMHKDMIDKSNVALHQHKSRAAFNSLLQPGVEYAYKQGMITEMEYLKLLSQLHEFELYPNG